jgi:hypothetical protein
VRIPSLDEDPAVSLRRMLRPVPSLLASALLATAVLTGCGGGDDGPDRASTTTTAAAPAPDAGGAAFRRAVAEGKTTIGSIGTDVETAIKGAAQQSDAELAQQFAALADRTRAALATLQGLQAPADATDELAALRTAVQTGATDLQAIATAADHGDAGAAKSATEALIAHSPAIGEAGDRLATVAGVTGADTGADGTSGKITVAYATPRTRTEKLAQQLLQVGGTDGVAAGFSQRFVLPTNLRIQAVRGFVGPNYDPSTKTVTLSYGFVDYIASILRRNDPKITDDDLGGQIAAIDAFILVHELGHAFSDVFQLPLTGREEDSVDQLATVFLVGGVNNGAQYAIQAARFFRLLFDDRKALKQSDYWDEHSLSIQRAYDIACLVAGSSEENFNGVRSLGILGRSRLQRCPSEWTKIEGAWQTLLKPHLRGS